MKKILYTILALAAAACCTEASAQRTVSVPNNADEVVVRWNNATAPHSNFETEDEQMNQRRHITHTSETVFYIFKADPAKATGQAVVVLPGGGYSKVCIGHEGFALAEWLRDNGITAVAVKYRLTGSGGHRDIPLEDAREALRYTREHAAAWNADPAKVGICGSSAGGYLAAHASTALPDDEKPAFAILFYPVISGSMLTVHSGTFKQMLADRPTSARRTEFSLENHVSKTTPPTLLLCCHDDAGTPTLNSILYYKALKEHGVRASMHIFPHGGHGWAGNDKMPYAAEYKAEILDWLTKLD